MKLLSIITLTTLLASVASADFVRIEGGIGGWESEPTGTISYNGNNSFDVVSQAGLQKETNMYAWVYIKHPIPIIPNLRVEYTDPGYSGTVTSITWDDNTYADVENSLSLTQYDAALYYNLLDNLFWITLDLGLDVKYIDGNYNIQASSTAGSAPAVDAPFSVVVPLVYGRGRVQLPFIDIGIESVVKGVTYSDNTVIDALVKIDYTMDFIPVIQPGLEIGYRYQQVTLTADALGIKADLDTTYSGLYAGVMLRF